MAPFYTFTEGKESGGTEEETRPQRTQPEPGTIGFENRRGYNETVMASVPVSDAIKELLTHTRTIAVVGLSDNPLRPSHGVSAYMQSQGYRIVPVNPQIEEALGEKAYDSLLEVPGRIDLVNVFRRAEFVPEIVDQAIQLKVPAIWMQEEVVNEAAAARAREAGIFVVMDACILKAHRARFG